MEWTGLDERMGFVKYVCIVHSFVEACIEVTQCI
jgi:hypothetical protein